jgi:hypothetical protein
MAFPSGLPSGPMLSNLFADVGPGGRPLRQIELEEFERRHGHANTTEMDALLYASFATRVEKSLSHKDYALYKQTIRELNKTPSTLSEAEKKNAQQVVQRLRAKAMSNNPEKVEEKRKHKEDIKGLRVRLVADASKRGLILLQDVESFGVSCEYGDGKLFLVHFDGDPAPSKKEYSVAQLKLLCATCGDKDGTYQCSRCKREPYCSAECQRASWPTHKLKCSGRKPPDSAQKK